MGETTCLMQPFSYTAGISNEANEGNPIHALGQSISLGRFVSESLSWEKWSTFSRNRYVEEAEKFSRPGSVAQKKAFFEAHYKSMAARKAAAAAALLEQANAAEASNGAEPGHEGGDQDSTPHDTQVVNTNSHIAANEEVRVKVMNNGGSFIADDKSFCAELHKFEGSKVEEVEPLTENENVMENCVKAESLTLIGVVDREEKVKEMELSQTRQMEKPLLKDFISNKDDSAPASMKKPAVSCSKSLIYGRGSKMPSSPAKPGPLLRAKKENNATPTSKKPTIDLLDKRKSTPKSVHKSINFTPVRELNRITSTIIRKIDNSRVGSLSKASKDCLTPLRTPLTASMLGKSEHALATPQSENRRAQTPVHPSASGSKPVRAKWHFLPTDCSKFMSGCRNKSQSPNLSAPFNFRTEERAARRKEKLEEKFNANQAQTAQMQTRLREKAETEIKKLRQSLCFKARPLPGFYKERGASKNLIEKVPLTHSESPKPGRIPTPTKVQCISQLSQRSSIKNSGPKQVIGRKSENPRSLASRLKTAQENTSPNIRS